MEILAKMELSHQQPHPRQVSSALLSKSTTLCVCYFAKDYHSNIEPLNRHVLLDTLCNTTFDDTSFEGLFDEEPCNYRVNDNTLSAV